MKTNTKGNDQDKKGTLDQTTGVIPGFSDTDALNILKNLLTSPSQSLLQDSEDKGRPVLLRHAQQCIDFYKVEMGNHGFTDPVRLMGNTRLKISRKITLYEEFSSANLLNWMVTTTDKLDPPPGSGKNLGLQLHFGILTKEFLSIYVKDPTVIERKLNRITVFLVFVRYKQDGECNIVTDDGDSEIMAYELGGLEP